MVYCTICKKAFRIDVSGKWQRFSNHKSHSIKDGGQNIRKSQLLIAINEFFQSLLNGKISMNKKTSLPPILCGLMSGGKVF